MKSGTSLREEWTRTFLRPWPSGFHQVLPLPFLTPVAGATFHLDSPLIPGLFASFLSCCFTGKSALKPFHFPAVQAGGWCGWPTS